MMGAVITLNSDTSKWNTTMNTDTYSQGYMYKLKATCRVDEFGKLILTNKLYMYIHIQDIP